MGAQHSERVMSQLSKVKHSRQQWKEKAKERADHTRYQRKQLARLKAERDRATEALKVAQAQLHHLERHRQGPPPPTQVDLVWMALQLVCVARIGFRAVSRVLRLLAPALGFHKGPCAQTVINWFTRLSIVRLGATSDLQGRYLPQAPFSNGLIWMIDLSIGLGSGKILAVLALDAHHHQLAPGAPSLHCTRCIGVAVAASWTGDTIAEFLKRLIASMGRPAAYLKDGGGELRKAVDQLAYAGLASPCLDDLSHAVAAMLKRLYQDHPAFETFLSACGRVSARLKHTLLACLAPPTVRSKARFMNVHRLFTWADRLLQLSPPGGARTASMLAKLRACLDQLPACKALIHRFRRDANALLGCQKILKRGGLSHTTRAQCEPLIDTMASAQLRREFRAYLDFELDTAQTLGLDHLGLPITSDAIESLFGVAKRHGVGAIQDATRMALRLPAFCGTPTREEAQQVLEVTVATQRAFTDQATSLTKQRREVLGHPERLERLGQPPDRGEIELLPSPKNRSNDQEIAPISIDYHNRQGPLSERLDGLLIPEHDVIPGANEMALAL
jgi:hypothetical protein